MVAGTITFVLWGFVADFLGKWSFFTNQSINKSFIDIEDIKKLSLPAW